MEIFGYGGLPDAPYAQQPGYYINQQFKRTRQLAWNKHKRHQAQHLILSFSDREFPTSNRDELDHEANQVNTLVQGFMTENFPDAQWISAVQCDGEGHKLHAHVLINSVKPADGKCVNTQQFKVFRLRHEWDKYLNEHYLAVVGHPYVNPYQKIKPATRPQVKGWQAKLRDTLEWARQTAQTVETYIELLRDKGVSITERNRRGDWSYHISVGGKDKTVRDFYQRRNRKNGQVKSTRGMGKDYTPNELSNYFKNKQFIKERTTNGKNDRDSSTNRLREYQQNTQDAASRFIRQAREQQGFADDETGFSGTKSRRSKRSQSEPDLGRD